MGKVLNGVALAIVGYVAGALVGWGAIGLFSSNTHDRSLEAAMTAAFVTGPLGALVALVVGFALLAFRGRAA